MATSTLPSTKAAAGVRTPASGSFSNPTTVGDMIKKMYPGYYDQMDSTLIGQRWIDIHTPQAGTGTGSGGTTDVLSGPTGSTDLSGSMSSGGGTGTSLINPNQTPDLNQFASPTPPPVKYTPQAPMFRNSSSASLTSQQPKSNPFAAPSFLSSWTAPTSPALTSAQAQELRQMSGG